VKTNPELTWRLQTEENATLGIFLRIRALIWLILTMSQEDKQTTLINDVPRMLLERVLVRLYDDVATINHRIQSVHTDVAYLVQTGQISSEDASFILSKVPVTTDPAITIHTLPSAALQGPNSPSPPPPSNNFVNNVPRKYSGVTTSVALQPHRPVPKPPVVNTFQVQALWDYNIDNEHADDLSFYANDVIEVDESSTEKNEDWWQGRIRGQIGLFPSSYVERIVHSLPPVPTPAPTIMKSSRPSSEVAAPTYTPYRSTHVAMNHYPSGGGPNALGLQPSQPDETMRGKYDHLKSTMANSAASGVGFGAGAALAGGLVRAIF